MYGVGREEVAWGGEGRLIAEGAVRGVWRSGREEESCNGCRNGNYGCDFLRGLT